MDIKKPPVLMMLVAAWIQSCVSSVPNAWFDQKEQCSGSSDSMMDTLRKEGRITRCAASCLREVNCFGFGINTDGSCQLLKESRDAVCGDGMAAVYSETRRDPIHCEHDGSPNTDMTACLCPNYVTGQFCQTLPDCGTTACQNSQPCVGGLCECNPWMAEGHLCETRITFLIQHKESGKYLTETGALPTDHAAVTLIDTPVARSYWQEVRFDPSHAYVFYKNEPNERYLMVLSAVETKGGAYGAEQMYQEEVTQFDQQGRRVIRLHSSYSGKYAEATSTGALQTFINPSSAGLFYLIRL